MNGTLSIAPGSEQDPAVSFLAWLQAAISDGTISQSEWAEQVSGLGRSACSMGFEHYNSSIATIRGWLKKSGLGIPENFPRPLTLQEFAELRKHEGCPLPEQQKQPEIKPTWWGWWALLGLGTVGISGGVLYAASRILRRGGRRRKRG